MTKSKMTKALIAKTSLTLLGFFILKGTGYNGLSVILTTKWPKFLDYYTKFHNIRV